MRSPNPLALRPLISKELSFLLTSRAYLASVLILCWLVGYSFVQAVDLFSEASRSALQYPDLARGMNPFEGVFVPTWGALYLISTFVFPFVAIRLLSQERQTGSLKLLLQSPFSPLEIVGAKGVAILFAWLIMALPALCVVPLWAHLGGHGFLPELCNLFLGHALYAFVIVGFALLVSSVSDSTSTAAILVLAFTLGSWVLDLNLTGHTGWLAKLSSLSLTANLRTFERGLFSSLECFRMLILGTAFTSGGIAFTQLGMPRLHQVGRCVLTVVAGGVLYSLLTLAPFYKDTREDRRNSFSPEDERALSEMKDPLSITVFMTPDDSRSQDFNRKVLWKLERLVPHLRTEMGNTGKAAFFGVGEATNYGRIVFTYNGKTESTLSNSPEEILPLLHRLSGHVVTKKTLIDYPGYPLVAQLGIWEWFFYLGFPLLFLGLWWILRNRHRDQFGRNEMVEKRAIIGLTLFTLLAHPYLHGAEKKGASKSWLPINDFSSETVGAEPTSFAPAVGNWTVGMDEGKKVLIVDGSKWEEGKASASIAEKSKAIYGSRYAEFLDGVKAYAYFPFAVATYVDDFADGEISVWCKPVAGRIDQACGIIFDVKPNGDYLILRANALEQNLVLFKYAKGKRSRVKWISEVTVPTKKWQELRLVVHGKEVQGFLDGKEHLKHTLSEGVSGKVGLWSKADTVTYYRDFTVKPSKPVTKGRG